MSPLIYAWRLDYHREERPQRLVLVAGLNDLLKGGDAEQLKESILDFECQVKHQNRYHMKRNEFYVAPLIIPPKLGWFLDNGPMPDGYINRLDKMRDMISTAGSRSSTRRTTSRASCPTSKLGATELGETEQVGSDRHTGGTIGEVRKQ